MNLMESFFRDVKNRDKRESLRNCEKSLPPLCKDTWFFSVVSNDFRSTWIHIPDLLSYLCLNMYLGKRNQSTTVATNMFAEVVTSHLGNEAC